jgi:PAS domain S-box-containing protein
VERAVLPLFAGLMTAAGLVLAALAGYVAWRRGTRAGLSLAILLVAGAWWGLSYAVELSVPDVASKSLWGDLKYVGICAVAPAWLTFVLQYTGRAHVVTRRLVAALMVEPVVVLGLLALGATHDLVHHYPRGAAGETLPVVSTGPVFWVHLAYSNLLIVVATWIFVATMVRLSRTYRRMALVLVVAALLPWVANILQNFEVGWFAQIDLTPFAFTVTGAVLVWGIFRERLVNLLPLARGAVMESMPDGVFVIDAFGRVADVNPAGAGVLAGTRAELVGRPLTELLPHPVLAGPIPEASGPGEAPQQLSLGEGGQQRIYDVQRRPLSDRSGRPAGELVVLRDITARVRTRQHLQRLLTEQSRVAAALQASLAPADLPEIPGAELAGRFEPAGDGSEIGGDFFDVFALGDSCWGLVLGDVSGKGAEAAAVTAQARYTLRALADPADPPSSTLRTVNGHLLATTPVETHCTLVYAVARPHPAGIELTISLAGHHPPLLLRQSGCVEPVGPLGTALGLFEDPELHDGRVVLHPGDLLCMFTDGLVEARHGTDLFGSDGVAAVLRRHACRPAGEKADELVAAARRFHRSDALADDLAILLLHARTVPPPGP